MRILLLTSFILLLGLASPFLVGCQGVKTEEKRAAWDRARKEVERLKTYIQVYQLETGEIPTDLRKATKPCKGYKPMITEDELYDPWGNPYQISISDSGHKFKIFTRHDGAEVSVDSD